MFNTIKVVDIFENLIKKIIKTTENEILNPDMEELFDRKVIEEALDNIIYAVNQPSEIEIMAILYYKKNSRNTIKFIIVLIC